MIDNLVLTFTKGGPVLYVIFAVSIYGAALVTERFLFYRRQERELADVVPLVDLAPEKICPETCIGRIYKTLMMQTDIDRQSRIDKARAKFLEESAAIDKRLGAIAVIASILPMLGLLGTVAGMIVVFDAIALHGTGDAKILADGISQALLTTAAGLITSIPLLYLHQILSDRADRIIRELDIILTHILHVTPSISNDADETTTGAD